MASASNPYKTDYTFPDPFRHDEDTIIPRYLGLDKQGDSGSFSMKLIIDQVATFNETIANIHGQDGISLYCCQTDKTNSSTLSVPQLIITLPGAGAGIAVLDYTCPEQWVWSSIHT